MGIFSKAVDNRTATVLRNHFGRDIPFEIVAGGTGTLHDTSINLRPFMCVMTEDALIFINKANVNLVANFNQILEIIPSQDFQSISVVLELNRPLNTRGNLEYPFSNEHLLTIAFNDPENGKIFLKKYQEFMKSVGASEEGLELLKVWRKMATKKPVIYSEYLKANENWKVSEDVKQKSYAVWGEMQDAENFLYYIARGICKGFIPPKLIHEVFDIFVEAQQKNSEFTKQDFAVSDQNKKMINDLSSLPDNSNFLEESKPFTGWAIGKIESKFDPIQPVIPVPLRWTLFNLRMSGGMPVMKVWDFFFEGNEVVYLADNKGKKQFMGHIIQTAHKFEAEGDHAKTFAEYCTY